MAQLLDETHSNETNSSVRWNDQDVLPTALEPTRLDPPTHTTLPRLRTGRLRFAPAPTRKTDEPATLARPTRRVDWVERVFEAGWMALMLGCAAECVYRLLWAVQS